MAAIREVQFGRLDVALASRPDGTVVVSSTEALPARPPRLTDHLLHWAKIAPDRPFLARQDAGGDWRKITFAETLAAARHIATALLARRLSPDRPIAILSGNGIEHALLALGAMLAGIPYAPISPAYSLVSTDFAKLRGIIRALDPQMVFVDDATGFARAIDAACPESVEVIAVAPASIGRPVTPFAALLAGADSSAIAAAEGGIGPDSIAKVLFTSGSTGMPKGVVTTHGMLTANQAMLQHWLPFHAAEPPVLVDWLPWNHTFGGSHNFGLALANGGTLYIDDGRPTPAGMAETLRNLREISPTLYFNVPKGYEEIVAALAGDASLRESFFARLKMTFYSGASLPQHVSTELDRSAVAATGTRILMVTGFGSTETAPAAMVNTTETALPGNVGVPLPGVSLKLVPTGDKLEARLRSPGVMPGYWRDPVQTAAAFDEDGFYCFGDGLRFATPGEPSKGFLFDGRIAEDFKLATGTWVSVGPLRQRVVSVLQPLARDVVIAGHDRSEVTALVFPDLDACYRLTSGTSGGARDLLASPAVRRAFQAGLAALAAGDAASSRRVAAIALLAEPPSIDANEITDKGSINQRAVLTRRADTVSALYDGRDDPLVIRLDPGRRAKA